MGLSLTKELRFSSCQHVCCLQCILQLSVQKKDLAGLEMPLSILPPQESYLVWGEGRENHQHKTLQLYS